MITEKDKERAEKLYPHQFYYGEEDLMNNKRAAYLQACDEKNQEMLESVEWVGYRGYYYKDNKWLGDDYESQERLIANSTEELFELFLKEKDNEIKP